jgi:HAMP domain-containing protein
MTILSTSRFRCAICHVSSLVRLVQFMDARSDRPSRRVLAAMTQQTSQNMPPPATQVAKQEVADVGRTTADAGRHVAGTAAEQAGQVAQEAKRQARDLVGEVRGQAMDQARTGQQNAADSIRNLAGELREMADNGEKHGTAAELAAQAADRLGGVADWIGAREPGDLVDEVRRFARRRPGVFLLGAAFAGILAGRLTRGTVDAQRDTGSDGDRYAATDATATPPTVPSPAVHPAGSAPVYAPPAGVGSAPAVGPAPGDYLGGLPPQPYAPGAGTHSSGSVPPRPSTPPSAPPVYPPSQLPPDEYVQETERGAGPAPGSAR